MNYKRNCEEEDHNYAASRIFPVGRFPLHICLDYAVRTTDIMEWYFTAGYAALPGSNDIFSSVRVCKLADRT